MNLSMKQNQGHTEQAGGCQGEGVERQMEWKFFPKSDEEKNLRLCD